MRHYAPWFVLCATLFVACKSTPPEPSATSPRAMEDLGATHHTGAAKPNIMDMSAPQAVDMLADIPTVPDLTTLKAQDRTDAMIDPKYTHIFIGQPQYKKGTVQTSYKKWMEEGPAMPVHDATIFHERHYVQIQGVEVVHGPTYTPKHSYNALIAAMDEDEDQAITVRFPLGLRAFKGIDYAIEEKDCAQMDALLLHPYVVLFAYEVYEDHGNSAPALGNWNDLGIDPRAPNKGFDTMAQAQEYAASVMSTP